MAIVKVNWSGGKDSTAAALLHIERGDKVKMVCYVPMFTKDIPLILKSHYDFILRATDYFSSLGADVWILSGMTYYDFVLHKKIKGQFKGSIMGFPCFCVGQCEFRNYSKIPSLSNCDVGHYDYVDIGIACDELNRISQLNENKRSILVELGYTEAMAKKLCIKFNLLSPNYNFENRDGCTLCPQAPAFRRIQWFKEYPEAIEILCYLQNKVKEQNKILGTENRTALRNGKWFIEPNYQLGIIRQDLYIFN